MSLTFPPPRAIDCSYCTDPIAVVAVEDSKYKVIEDRRDIICSKLCFHLFHEKCIYKWIEQGGSCPICRDEEFSRNIVHFDNFTATYGTYLNAIEDTELKPAANARLHRLSRTGGGLMHRMGLLIIVSVALYVIFKVAAYIYRKLKKPEPPPKEGKVLDITPSKGLVGSPFLQKFPK